MTSVYMPRVDALVRSDNWLGNGPINFAEALPTPRAREHRTPHQQRMNFLLVLGVRADRGDERSRPHIVGKEDRLV